MFLEGYGEQIVPRPYALSCYYMIIMLLLGGVSVLGKPERLLRLLWPRDPTKDAFT